MLKTKQLADSILQINIDSQDGKDTFFATVDELVCLLDAGADKVRWNFDQGDGTYTHEIIYKKFKFICSTTEPLP